MTNQEIREVQKKIDVLFTEEEELEKEIDALFAIPLNERQPGLLKQIGDLVTKHTNNLNEMKRLGRLLGMEV